MVLAPQLATWPSGLGKGLQSPVPGFDSLRRLYFVLQIFLNYFATSAVNSLNGIVTPTDELNCVACLDDEML